MADIKRKAEKKMIRRTAKFAALALIPAIIILFVSFKSCERRQRLDFVPNGLKVSKIIYAAEESRGFGPGGNESGVIVYELPETVAEEIKKNGLKFFSDALESGQSGDDRAERDEKWEETPLLSDSSWRDAGEGQTTPNPQIENYVNRYGVGVAVEPDAAREINSIILKGGAYFARRRVGVIIVSPEVRRVIYAYSG